MAVKKNETQKNDIKIYKKQDALFWCVNGNRLKTTSFNFLYYHTHKVINHLKKAISLVLVFEFFASQNAFDFICELSSQSPDAFRLLGRALLLLFLDNS